LRTGELKARRQRPKRNKPRLIVTPQKAAVDKPAEKTEQEEAPEAVE